MWGTARKKPYLVCASHALPISRHHSNSHFQVDPNIPSNHTTYAPQQTLSIWPRRPWPARAMRFQPVRRPCALAATLRDSPSNADWTPPATEAQQRRSALTSHTCARANTTSRSSRTTRRQWSCIYTRRISRSKARKARSPTTRLCASSSNTFAMAQSHTRCWRSCSRVIRASTTAA